MTDLKLSRRMLLKAGVAGVSSITLGGSLLVPFGPGRAGEAGKYVSLTTGRLFQGTPSTCALCPAGCGILGFVGDRGEPEGVAGNPGHPFNQGSLCALGSSAMNLPGSALRVRAPLRRVGPRGAGSWEAVSWDRALSDLVEALGRHLNGPRSAGGPAVCVPERRLSCFLDRFTAFFEGGSLEVADGYEIEVERSVHRAFSGTAADGLADLEHADLVLNFGADPLGSVRRLLSAGRSWSQAVRGGTQWITLDPRLSETAAATGGRWIPVRPGTDGAFASAVARRILQEGREDRGFLKRLPAGEEARIRDTLAQWSEERAARVCGVSVDTIRQVSAAFAGAGRAVAVFGSGVTARENGERDARAILFLNFLKGSVDRKGGYRLLHDTPWEQPGPPLPRTSGLAYPGTLFRELELDRRSVDTLITLDANPAATDPGGTATVDVLKSPERVPFHVALASVWNETVHLADLVLPAATFLEEWGLVQGVCPADGSGWVGLRQPVFRAASDVRPAEAVLLEAARSLGPRGKAVFPFRDMERYYREVLEVNLPREDAEQGIRDLRERGFLVRPGIARSGGPGAVHTPARQDRAQTDREIPCLAISVDAFPSASGDGTRPEGSAAAEPATGVCDDDEKPGRRAGTKEKTLVLFGSPVQGPDAAGLEWVEELEHNRPLWMHPVAAQEAGCSEGDWVRVRGPGGEVRTRVRLIQGLHPDTVAMRSAGAGVNGPAGPPAPLSRGRRSKPARVWWAGRIYGENVRKLIPWPPEPGTASPAWQGTRVTVVRESKR